MSKDMITTRVCKYFSRSRIWRGIRRCGSWCYCSFVILFGCYFLIISSIYAQNISVMSHGKDSSAYYIDGIKFHFLNRADGVYFRKYFCIEGTNRHYNINELSLTETEFKKILINKKKINRMNTRDGQKYIVFDSLRTKNSNSEKCLETIGMQIVFKCPVYLNGKKLSLGDNQIASLVQLKGVPIRSISFRSSVFFISRSKIIIKTSD